MRNVKSILALLAVTFAVMMSLPFLVPHLGFLALFGIVPLLMMEEVADAHGVKHFFWWYYAAFVLWNALTTFWVCNATVGGGIFAVVANAAQMALIFAVFRFSRKRLSPILSYVLLAALWIAWERWYLVHAQISWPWLVLGNAFARDIRVIQWYEYTGVLGGSLWVWTVNITAWLLLKSLMQGSFGTLNIKARTAAAIFAAAVLFAPFAWSLSIWNRFEEKSEDTLRTVIAQPNFDPYQKFQALSQAQQDVILLDLLQKGLKGSQPGRPLLMLAPETFTSDVDLDEVESGYTWNRFRLFLDDWPDANLLMGASTHQFYETEERPSINARHLRDGRWYESHNSALMMDRTGRTGIFHKSKLVVGTELTPYPKIFVPIDNMLGGVMGRCIGQDSVTVLHAVAYDAEGNVSEDIPVGSVICYESIYGEYCTEYVRKGAKALAVITNDAWWGDTPGYRQHLSYSSLRAIETRRDIARCANTGISCFINQRGEISQPTPWWESAVITGDLNLCDETTFFVENGDVTGRVCTFVALLMMLLLLVREIRRRTEL